MLDDDPSKAIEDFVGTEGTGLERSEANRKRLDRIFAATRRIVEREGRAQPPARRDQHAKHCACVWAYLDVLPNIDPRLAHGVFAKPKRYLAWVRFSNSSPRPQSDAKLDGRALAIKLLEVAGDRAASAELTLQKDTQDFILLNNPAFFAEDLEEMARIFEWQAEGRALPWYFVRNLRIRGLVQLLKHGVRPDSPLQLTYHSQLAFRLGPLAGVRYRLKPLSGIERIEPTQAERESGNHLRHVLQRQLVPTVSDRIAARDEQAAGDVVFSLEVLEPEADDSLSRGNKAWQSKNFTEVARLRIPRQDFNHPRRQSFAEHVSFSVWNALKAHRPVGALNWARAPAYAYIRHLRHRLNDAQDFEYTRAEWEALRALPARPLPSLNDLTEVLEELTPRWQGYAATFLRSRLAPFVPVILLVGILVYIFRYPQYVGGPTPTAAALAALGLDMPSEKLIPEAKLSQRFQADLARRPAGYALERDPTWLFRYGSMGAEFSAGIPYWIYRVLPRIAPEQFREKKDWSIFGLMPPIDDDEYYADYHQLPRGLILSDTIARIGNNDISVPLKRVALNCASCHRGEVREPNEGKTHYVDGMPNLSFDAAAFKRQTIAAITGQNFTAARVLNEIDNVLDQDHRDLRRVGPAPRLTRWERGVYIKIIEYMQRAAREKELLLRWIDRRPLNGPGRLDAFGALRFENFRMPDDALLNDKGYTGNYIATVDLPSIWNQGSRVRPRHHYDGNTADSRARNVGAIVGVGGDPLSIRFEDVQRVGDWIDHELDAPPFPFDLNQERVERGKEVFVRQCQSCHGSYDERGRLIAPADCTREAKPDLVGTDPARLLAIDEPFVERLNAFGERTGLWEATAFSGTRGYLCPPLDGIWARAPYLHNGSVPTLDDLLKSGVRTAKFLRGNPEYDIEKGGFRTDKPSDDRLTFELDTTVEGNLSQGHNGPKQLVPDASERRDVIEYLYSLSPSRAGR